MTKRELSTLLTAILDAAVTQAATTTTKRERQKLVRATRESVLAIVENK